MAVKMERIKHHLAEIQTLIRKYGYEAQASAIDRMLAVGDSDPPEFLILVDSATIWGSSGSVFDIDLTATGTPEAWDDQRHLHQLLLQIAEDLVACGDPTGHAAAMVGVLRQWLNGDD